MNGKVESLGKLSLKKMFGVLEVPAEPRALCVIYGVADGFKSRPTDAGQLITFTGNFEAVEILTLDKQLPVTDMPAVFPRKFESDGCVLPPNAEKALLKVWDSPESNLRVEFAMELSIAPRKTALGFDILFKNIVAPVVQSEDPLQRVRAEVTTFLAPTAVDDVAR